MLPSLNVFDVKSKERSRILVQVAVFTAIARPIPHQFLGRNIHLLFYGWIKRLARDWRMVTKWNAAK